MIKKTSQQISLEYDVHRKKYDAHRKKLSDSPENKPLSDEERHIAHSKLDILPTHEDEHLKGQHIFADHAGIKKNKENLTIYSLKHSFDANDHGEKWSTRETVPIHKIMRSQTFIPKEGVRSYINNINHNPELPEYVHDHDTGLYHVASGHTRTAAQMLAGRKEIQSRVYHFKDNTQIKPPKMIKEDAPTNSAGGSAIAGTGSTAPVVPKIGKHQVFDVSPDYYHKSVNGKRKFVRYDKYVGNDDMGKQIREYATDRKTAHLPVIIRNSQTGAHTFLKYGRKSRFGAKLFGD